MKKILATILFSFLIAIPFAIQGADLGDAFKVDDTHVCKPGTNDRLDCAANAANYNVAASGQEVTPETITRTLVNIILSILGILFMIMIILAGSRWMLAGGNEEKVSKNKRVITESIVGLAIVLGAYAISYLVLYYVFQ